MDFLNKVQGFVQVKIKKSMKARTIPIAALILKNVNSISFKY